MNSLLPTQCAPPRPPQPLSPRSPHPPAHLSQPPPPPPPPPPLTLYQRPTSKQLATEINRLLSDTPVLEGRHVIITQIQFDLLNFSNNLVLLGGYYVELLSLAGAVSLWRHRSNAFMKLIADQLLPRLQALESPSSNPSAREYHQQKLLTLLGHHIILCNNEYKTQGVLQGLFYVNTAVTLIIRGTDMWEIQLDISCLEKGSAYIEQCVGSNAEDTKRIQLGEYEEVCFEELVDVQ